MKREVCFCIILFLFIHCKKQSKDICSQLIITTNVTPSAPCTAEGQFQISFPVGRQFNNSSFQQENIFSQLRPGAFNIVIRESNNCEYKTSIIIPETTAGPLFTTVKSLLSLHCITCHSGNNPQAGLNWTNTCDILQYWDRIKARAVDGNPSPMPQGGLLPLSERNKITDRINAGHRYSD
jgi:hypothetical protein